MVVDRSSETQLVLELKLEDKSMARLFWFDVALDSICSTTVWFHPEFPRFWYSSSPTLVKSILLRKESAKSFRKLVILWMTMLFLRIEHRKSRVLFVGSLTRVTITRNAKLIFKKNDKILYCLRLQFLLRILRWSILRLDNLIIQGYYKTIQNNPKWLA
jgi:hypothetical protein